MLAVPDRQFINPVGVKLVRGIEIRDGSELFGEP
jgi:hypothetical protein